MAAYFPGQPEIHPEGLQTLYLMNPSFAGYSDSPGPTSAQHIFLNNSLTPTIPQQQQQQHFVGIPLPPSQHSVSPRPIHYTPWAGPSPSPATNPQEFEPQLGPRQQQGLSLSLSPLQQSCSGSDNGLKAAGLQSVVMGSKYLKAAQELLDEVANVGNTSRGESVVAASSTMKNRGKEPDCDGVRKKAADLSTAEMQELQMKKAKLVSMLDEVEQRHRQYRQHMQMVVSLFEVVAGIGSARSYTSLALRTISKQFRCLRDAISGQIRAAARTLGEEDGIESSGRSSRLRLVDHQLRQQRARQQLGMIQHSAWRPQRGLPERAVSVLRAWLFEHFLHPYPKDSDKHMLAKQTGLTRGQVSNWFINARVRLWKPMVEEMYLEETKQQQQQNHNNNNGDDNQSKSKSESSEHSASKSASQQLSSPSRTEHNDEGLNLTQNGNLSGFESIMQQSMKRARSDQQIHQNSTIPDLTSMGMAMKPDEMSNRELLMKFMGQGGGYGTYPMGEIARFEHEQFAPRFGANGVSLTLGLPHCETLSLTGPQQPSCLSNEEGNYFGLNNGVGSSNNNSNDPSTSRTPNGYEGISIESRKRFAAHLLPDYLT